VFHHTPALVLALGIGIGIGQYYWVLGASFGIVLTLMHSSQSKSCDNMEVKQEGEPTQQPMYDMQTPRRDTCRQSNQSVTYTSRISG